MNRAVFGCLALALADRTGCHAVSETGLLPASAGGLQIWEPIPDNEMPFYYPSSCERCHLLASSAETAANCPVWCPDTRVWAPENCPQTDLGCLARQRNELRIGFAHVDGGRAALDNRSK